jgi:hypothetical protein
MLIKELFNQFLSDQLARVSRQTYRDYALVMGLFADYLNSNAWHSLDDGDNAYMEAMEQEQTFIDLYDHAYIEDNIEDFLNDFVLRKVVGWRWVYIRDLSSRHAQLTEMDERSSSGGINPCGNSKAM